MEKEGDKVLEEAFKAENNVYKAKSLKRPCVFTADQISWWPRIRGCEQGGKGPNVQFRLTSDHGNQGAP